MNPTTVLKTSICILGAGPAGICLGNILLQNGIDCIVIDKYNREEIYARGRAGAIESTTFQLLQKYGLADTIIKNGRIQNSCEFRYPHGSIIFEYSDLSEGDVHYIYPQSDLNDDLIQKYIDAGGKIFLHHEGQKITQTEDGITVECYAQDLDQNVTIQADFVAGCDGYHGLARQSIPEQFVTIYNKEYNYRWLAILAYAPPAANHAIYALHPDGFAAFLLRSSQVSRFYLQIPLHDELKDWSDNRIWENLHKRLAKAGWELPTGTIFEKRIMGLRNYVIEPLRYERLFMAGDAAHIITPMGGKGLNLAVQDAGVLAETLVSYYLEKHDISYLERYSEIRLPYIWRAQEFSYGLLNMLHKSESDNPDDVRFQQKLSEAKLLQLTKPTTFAKNFARNYVGII
ncbi:4-hydroxybenzoate 3-monooxygenase [Nostoc sp. UHCC 0870]|uniref:4-hydroxybenzoate 3-monooxygenase n=1 Tax=Nostoc sp. UHCC 0870 TaxID=2914041 RepID=UPI001EDD518C|nr:4-hydroxybenzoate 3-monooxygenase [Nostoc sp. UHCC 0870]UKO99749.1 4-hydroxybenzoate 3-monooxygenase [Nostoc sp. UHCC 0870]